MNGDVAIETLGLWQAQDRVREAQRAALKACGKLAEGQELYIGKTTSRRGPEIHKADPVRELPNEHKRHRRVSDEKLAKRYEKEQGPENKVPR